MSLHCKSGLGKYRSISLQILRSHSSIAVSPDIVVQSKPSVKPYSDIPSPPAWPVIGHLPLMMKKESQLRMDKMFEGLRQEYGDIYKMWMPAFGHTVAVFKPEDIKMLYANEGKSPQIPGFDLFQFMRSKTMKDRYVTVGLLSNTEDWYEIRNRVQQDMMRPKSALYYISEMEDIALELADKIQELKGNDGILDPYDLLQNFALEAVGCVFMGSRLGAIQGEGDGQKLIDAQSEVLALFQKLWMTPQSILPYLPAYKKIIKHSEVAFDICKKHVDKAIANIKETDDTVIAKLVRKCGKDSAIPLIMGIDALQVGIDTTGTSAAFLLYHLADNPDKQDLLYQEICDTIGPNGALTESALVKMKYMKACQTESQRMVPAVWGSSRRAVNDIVVGGYQIPKGTTILRCGSTSSNDPTNFQNPEKFLPERWLRGCPERHNADSFANIPFGHGARACIGQRFARMELYAMMVKLVQRYRMEYTGEPVGFVTKLINVPDKPINIKFSER